jgi:hypothetical protein
MEQPHYDMSNLFAQLGEANDEKSIARFIASHKLKDELHLHEAKFWTTAQAKFLREAICDDSDWAIVVDELNTQLHVHH